MRKPSLLLVVLSLVMAFVTGILPAEGAPAADEMPVFDYNITMPTGSMGGSYYVIGSAMSELFSSRMKGVTISSSAANTSDNVVALLENETILATIGATDYNFMLEELPTDSTAISSVGVFNQLVSVIVVREDSKYHSIADLAGQKINLGASGTGQYLFNKALLETAGFSESDFQCEYMSQGDASEAFAEGKLEAVFAFISVPASAITQMAVTTKCRILQPDEALLNKFLQQYTYYKPCSVDPETVPDMGVSQPYQTISQYGELVVRNDVDEEFVYWLTRTLYENYDALIASAPGAAVCTAENSVKYTAFNLHPGAQRYFKEKNLLQ